MISIVAPMFNEEVVLNYFFKSIAETLNKTGREYEIICVNDGSKDGTYERLLEFRDNNPRIKILNLARNFGKEIALTAGLDHCSGDAIIPIDCDLQDPPSVILEMIEKWEEGFDMVLAKRIDRRSDSWMKRATSSLFYSTISKLSEVEIPPNVGDFRLFDKKVLRVLKEYRERSRFMKGVFADLGFRQATIEYVREERVAGKTKWNYLQLYKLGLEGIISFSSFPLKVWSYIGATVAFLAFCYGLFLVLRTLIFGVDTPGYASLMVVTLFIGGLNLLSLGIVGEYVSRIFLEVKQRPLYIIMDAHGINEKHSELR